MSRGALLVACLYEEVSLLLSSPTMKFVERNAEVDRNMPSQMDILRPEITHACTLRRPAARCPLPSPYLDDQTNLG